MYSIMTNEENRDISHKLAIFCLVVILVLSALARFWCLTDNPPVTYFEKLHADYARSFASGIFIVDGKPLTFFSPKLFYPPLFHSLGALVFKTLSKATISLRLIGGVAGILTTFALYLIGAEIASRRTGLFSALLFAIYPSAVHYNRFVIPQNLAMLWLTFAFLFLMRARNHKSIRYLYFSAVLIAVSTFTVYSSIFFVFLLYVVAEIIDKKYTKPILLISLLPLLLLFVIMLFFRFKSVFSDLGTAVTFGVTESDHPLPAFAFFKGIVSFVFHDWFIIFGILGIFFYQSRYPWYLFFAVLATSLGGFTGQAGYNNGLYPALILSLPFVLLGSGRMTQVIMDNVTSLINTLFHYTVPTYGKELTPGKVVALIGFYMIIILILHDLIPQVRLSFFTS